MLQNFFLLITVTVVFASVSFAQSANDNKQDETAVRQIVQQLEDAWNAHDGKAFAAPFASDADYVIVNGAYIKGREPIERGHTQIFSTVYSDSRNAGTVKSIRFLRPDVAVVHVEWNLVYSENGAERNGHAYTTLVMSRENGKWSIAAFQNTPILTQNR